MYLETFEYFIHIAILAIDKVKLIYWPNGIHKYSYFRMYIDTKNIQISTNSIIIVTPFPYYHLATLLNDLYLVYHHFDYLLKG